MKQLEDSKRVHSLTEEDLKEVEKRIKKIKNFAGDVKKKSDIFEECATSLMQKIDESGLLDEDGKYNERIRIAATNLLLKTTSFLGMSSPVKGPPASPGNCSPSTTVICRSPSLMFPPSSPPSFDINAAPPPFRLTTPCLRTAEQESKDKDDYPVFPYQQHQLQQQQQHQQQLQQQQQHHQQLLQPLIRQLPFVHGPPLPSINIPLQPIFNGQPQLKYLSQKVNHVNNPPSIDRDIGTKFGFQRHQQPQNQNMNMEINPFLTRPRLPSPTKSNCFNQFGFIEPNKKKQSQ